MRHAPHFDRAPHIHVCAGGHSCFPGPNFHIAAKKFVRLGFSVPSIDAALCYK